jgi:hypothetical protein
MHSLMKSLVAVVLVVGSTALAQSEGEVVIRTRDGKSRQGRVISETQKGFLFAGPRGTSVIEFASIVDLQKVEPIVQAPLVAAAPPPPPPVPAPSTPAPVVAPVVSPVPPPPPERPSIEVATDAPMPEKSRREGFHFGIGANVGFNNGGPSAQLQAHFEFNFGRPVYRINANLGALVMYSSGFVSGSVDNLFQFNIGDVYAFGGGVQVGVAVGPVPFLYLAPVIQPVIIKLGERGQHQLSLTGSVVALSTWSSVGQFDVTYAGTVQVFAGYSFLF